MQLKHLSFIGLALPLASALQIQIPPNPTSDGTVTIKWTKEANDPDVFSMELTNPSFHNTFAIANNVKTSDGSITLTLPTLPAGDGYTITAHDISNINQVFGQTSDFNIGASTASSTATTAASGSAANSVTRTSIAGVSQTAPGGTTVRNSGTGDVLSTASRGASSAASAGASSAPSSFNNGAVKFSFNAATISAAVLSMVAGAAFVAL